MGHASIGIAQSLSDSKVIRTLGEWKQRLERVKSVRYELSGEIETVSKDEVPPELKARMMPLPRGTEAKPLKVVLLIDIHNKRLRVEETEPIPSQAGDRWVPRLRITSFDGRSYQQSWPREKNDRSPEECDISVSKGSHAERRATESHLWPAFIAHGIVPTVNDPLRLDRWPIEHDPEGFVSLGQVAHAGRSCALIRTTPTGTSPNLSDQFWVDEDRQGAVLRHVYLQGRNPLFRFDIEYSQTNSGWYPQKWTQVVTLEGKVRTRIRIDVDSLEINPTLEVEQFTLPIRAGMIVQTYDYPPPGKGLDTARPAKGKYRVNADGEWVGLEPTTGFTTTEGIQLPPEAKGQRLVWLMLGLATMSLIAYFGVRSLRRKVSDLSIGRV
jgi:hypothetical protein